MSALEVRLKGILAGTASWVRVLDDGRVELEYYDHSSSAQDWFGNDVAWMYRIDAALKSRLWELMGALTATTISDDQAMLDALVQRFGDVRQVKEWLAKMQVPYEEEFDSWA